MKTETPRTHALLEQTDALSIPASYMKFVSFAGDLEKENTELVEMLGAVLNQWDRTFTEYSIGESATDIDVRNEARALLAKAAQASPEGRA